MNKQQIIEKVQEINKKAIEIFGKFGYSCESVDVEFFDNPNKLVSGYAYPLKNLVMFNLAVARINSDKFHETVIHEIAHLVTEKVFPKAKQAHGPEFKRVDLILGGRGKRCSENYAIPERTKKRKTVDYKCHCGIIQMSMIRHNRILAKEAAYRCTKCASLFHAA